MVRVTVGEYWPPVLGGILLSSLVFRPSVLWEQDVGGSNPLAPLPDKKFLAGDRKGSYAVFADAKHVGCKWA